MKRTLIISIAILIFCINVSYSDNGGSHYYRNSFLMTPSSVFYDGLLGYSNPANLGMIRSAESRFYWSTDGSNAGSFNNWGSFVAAPHFGLGVQSLKSGEFRITDYRIGLGFGSQAHTFGIGYNWTTGDNDYFGREKILSLGSIERPFPFLSLSVVGHFSMESKWNEAVAELGIRPLGNSKLTVFADGAFEYGMKAADIPWSAGATFEIATGIDIIGRYFDEGAFTLGFSLNFGQSGIGGQSYYDKNQKNAGYSYFARSGANRPSLFPEKIQKDKKFLPIHIKGMVNYQNYVFFDNSLRFMDLLKAIQAAGDDDRIAALALNLSGMRIYPEMAWEIREELNKLKSLGKKIIIFFDTPYMTSYHLASVADKIVMDPEGAVVLTGFSSSRTYFKGSLEKLGLGFDEWRFMKYKSAAEALSRDSYSDADEEQAQDYVNDRYENMRAEVCNSRALTYDDFDRIINDEMFFLAENALAEGLVDTLARWSDRNRIMANLLKQNVAPINSKSLLPISLVDNEWGDKPRIAVVYALGVCAMDTGIRARWLEQTLLSLARNHSVAGVVLRVDSPGGDGIASDMVAEALKKCAQIKPVIISQGQMAASGGYWISMYGHRILAGPNTITGSIGVIGGWLYDNGIGNKLGITSDHVKQGEHADYNRGITIPFINQTIPARNLTETEREKVKNTILEIYDGFMQKVANGRNLPIDSVRQIAEGHYYSGVRGKELGLVDEIGGLMTAIKIAINSAGFENFDDIEIVEIPRYKGAFNLKSKISPVNFGIESLVDDEVLQYIRMTLDNRYRAMPMLYPGSYPGLEK